MLSLCLFLLTLTVTQANFNISVCPDTWIDCGNGECVSHLWRCDNDNDCGNHKDEENCEGGMKPKACLSSQFQCVSDGHCIPDIWHCDGGSDCDDKSDENNCQNDTHCHGFRCQDNKCIPEKWRCDGNEDCLDGSDEESCPKDKVCLDSEFACSSGTCVERSRVCDSKKDCPDGSDEGQHCNETCDNSTCSQKCRNTPNGPQCYCNSSYALGKDNRTCSDIDECSEDGFCSQRCTNLIGSYKCSCLDGYELVNRSCISTGPEPLLVFSTIHEIRGRYLRSKRYFPIRKAVYKAAAVDADIVESKIYWVEISNKSSVYSTKVDGGSFDLVMHNGLMIPEDIAVDYVGRNLYFTDSGLRQVLACKMDGSMCYVIHKDNIEKPRALALDPAEGLMYWSDWGDKMAGIYLSGMDGSRRFALVSKDIKWPNGITVDHTTNRLYWSDAQMQSIEYVTLDGKTRKVVLKDTVFHPYSLAVFEDNLYWSDWSTFSLETCNKFNGHNLEVMIRENGKHIMGVHVYHPLLAKTASNPCWSSGCSHMCLVAPMKSFKCACPQGFVLSSNGRTCLVDDKYPMLLVNDESSVYHVRPEAVGSGAVTVLPLSQLNSIGSLAYDWNGKMLFATDKKTPSIISVNMSTWVRREIVKNHLVALEDIAFDPTSGNLYWVDTGKGTVEIVSTKTYRTSVVIVDLHKPKAIALAPSRGWMFVSTVGDDASVARYDMDGKNKMVLPAVGGLVTALAVHPTESLLYWVDQRAETVSVIDYLSKSSSQPKLLKRKVGSAMSLAVSDTFLYWTDSKNHALNLLKHNTSYLHTVDLPGHRSGLTGRRVIYASAPQSRRVAGSRCDVNNGLCSHLCLTSPKGRTCVCPPGMQLSSNNSTCTEKDCTPDEFQCVKNKKCIPREFMCDGIKDCDDGSDESCEEPAQRCPGNDFQCRNGRCILSAWKCDRRDDCGDNSDEAGCPTTNTCTKDQFTCGSGDCIPNLWRCDGENDCSDDSDEWECHTTECDAESQIRCDHGQCIPKSWGCDGAQDCYDGTDERNCGAVKVCGHREFKCGDGRCIDNILVCDTRTDCEDGSDEKNCTKSSNACPAGRFPCQDGTCVYSHDLCDGYKDCPNGDDELNCTAKTAKQCSKEEYFCSNNSRCISARWLCDGDDDCGDAADERPENCTKRNPTMPPYNDFLACEEFFCQMSGECISTSKVCDGNNDCEDLTDEGPLCAKACRGNGGCSHICNKTPQGSQCSCYNGYRLMGDGITCEDFNECLIPGSCSHFCNNTKGGYKCSCADGYFLEHNHKRCKADGGPATLVYLLPDQIRGIDLGTMTQRVYVNGESTDMRGMDYDSSEGTFFWSDWKEGTINSFTPNTNKRDVLLTTLIRPTYLKWDWLAKNFYYTDDEGNIVACSKDGKFCTVVVEKAVLHFNGFDISPTRGLMFWCVWELVIHKNNGVIERAELDGSNRIVIVDDQVIWPTAITVDHVLNMVCWTDSKLNTLECSDFHGLKRRMVIEKGLYFPFSLTLFEDHVFWSDWGTASLRRCDKFVKTDCISLDKGNVKAEVMMIVHRMNQPKSENRCQNSRCPQLCLPTRTNYVCKCADNYRQKNSTCEAIPVTTPVIPSYPTPPYIPCPKDYCEHGAPCSVINERFVCDCPPGYFGSLCGIHVVQADASKSKYDYSWVVAVVLSVLVIIMIVVLYFACKKNKDKLSKVKETISVTFRNNGFGRKSGQLVMDTDDQEICEELMVSQTGDFKASAFGNPLFGKKPPKLFPDVESNDGEFKRWPSYDSGDSAFVSESQNRENGNSDDSSMKERLVNFF